MSSAILAKYWREFRAQQIQREVGNMFLEGELEKRREEEERKIAQRRRRLERRNLKFEPMVVRGKKEDKYDIDQVLSFVGDGTNKEEKDCRKTKGKKKRKTSKKGDKASVEEVAGEEGEMGSVFEDVDSLKSENELLKLDWMRLERENVTLRSNLEAGEAREARMREENVEKLIAEKEQCRELGFELERTRSEKWEIEKKLETTAVQLWETNQLWEREKFFGSELQKKVDALEEQLQRQKEQSVEREMILKQRKEEIKQRSLEMLEPDSVKTKREPNFGKTKQVNCERVQKMKRHTSAITSRLQVKFKTLEYDICEFYMRFVTSVF